ncbi:unnamed protein product [Leptosia nina]|uniref:Androgen-dependent TFPI-regulating protein-like n=1 Tax=Leptosia nina TaxID=320188 RepID=A0AAV1JKK0_9NEOP
MTDALRSPTALLTIRLCFYSVAFVHLLIVALVLLNVDMSIDSDPAVRLYTVIRWRLLTIWFNMTLLVYFPICFYCDWMEKNGRWNDVRIRYLRQVRDLSLTSILLPTTLYCDTLFWRVWNKDPGIIAPVGIFTYLPYWTHHSLHSVSAVVVLLDLLMVPRRRPPSLWPGALVLTTFITLYSTIVVLSYYNGIVVYAVLNMFDRLQIFLLMLMSYLELYFYYTIQWCVVDGVWKKRTEGNKIKSS